ncbi:hypothetical protein HPP92_027872 [Vanilla planifolia]|uniref:Uncharacterized protein n=1 Tax=Vanilla planifolia TaxID=51239 RepID=A0A835PDC2_VANPL|nr:hypothetical protein HPP92_027872 [Vanilla planifolia]
MAAAEARAAWQRAANRCLVQEDAKRAPKLACCQSSSAQLHDSNSGNATTGQHKCISNFVPLNWNHMSSNLPPDTKWWLQHPTNFPSQKDLIFEQKTSKNERGEFEEATNKASFEGHIPTVSMKGCPLESSWIMPEVSIEHDSGTQVQDMKAVTSICPQQKVETEKDHGACWLQSELLNIKPFDSLPSHKADETCFDFNVPWEGINKCEPWWRISDEGELASLVAQKSLQNIENCDLPRPAHTSRSPYYCHESWEGNRFSLHKDAIWMPACVIQLGTLGMI